MKKSGIILSISTLIAISVIGISACSKKTTQDKQAALDQYMETMSTGGAADKVPDPTAESVEIVAIYTPTDDGVEANMDDVDLLNASEILSKLKEYKVLPEDAKVESFDIENSETEVAQGPGADSGDVEVGSGKLVLTNAGSLEGSTIQAVADTYIEAFNLSTLTIVADGKTVASDVEFQKYN